MLALWLALAVDAEAARGFAGLEWRPLSRQDLVFVEEDRTSGTAVGEHDGTVRPGLSAFGGAWLNKYVALVGGFGVAAIHNRAVADEVVRKRTWAVLRPSLDVRLGWLEPRVRFPIPWFVLGIYGDIPTVSDRSNAFTAEEQELAAQAAYDEELRLGGVGGRLGAGVDFRVVEGLSLGAQLTVGLHHSAYAGSDDTFTTLWVSTEASLLLTFEWPERRRSREAPDVQEDPVLQGAADQGADEG